MTSTPATSWLIADWDKATRSMWDGLQIIKAVIDAGASIKVLDRSYIDLETPIGRGFMAMTSAMAEDERLWIIKRTHEGRKIAQAKGVRMGRKPLLTPHQQAEARRRIAKGEATGEGDLIEHLAHGALSNSLDPLFLPELLEHRSPCYNSHQTIREDTPMSPTYFSVRMAAADKRFEPARKAQDIPAMQVVLAEMTRLMHAYYGHPRKA